MITKMTFEEYTCLLSYAESAKIFQNALWGVATVNSVSSSKSGIARCSGDLVTVISKSTSSEISILTIPISRLVSISWYPVPDLQSTDEKIVDSSISEKITSINDIEVLEDI